MAQTLRSPLRLTMTQLVESPREGWHRGRGEPMVRLRGGWLEENGFVAGARVVVTVERGRIVVTLASEV